MGATEKPTEAATEASTEKPTEKPAEKLTTVKTRPVTATNQLVTSDPNDAHDHHGHHDEDEDERHARPDVIKVDLIVPPVSSKQTGDDLNASSLPLHSATLLLFIITMC